MVSPVLREMGVFRAGHQKEEDAITHPANGAGNVLCCTSIFSQEHGMSCVQNKRIVKS